MPGQNGEPAMLTYTVREHLGDRVTEPEGGTGISIQFADRELPDGKTLLGRKVTLQSAWIIGMERDIRLEPRLRPSAAALRDPDRAGVEALKARHGVGTIGGINRSTGGVN